MGSVLPRRYRGGPPLFYPVVLVALAWGLAFLFHRLSGIPVPAWERLHPAPPLPGPASDTVASFAAALGIAQAVATLRRAKWAWAAACLWFACLTALSWMLASSADGVVSAILSALLFAALAVYYYQRRRWFGRSQ